MLITVEELTERLNVKESWIRSQVLARKIPFLKIGRHIRFDATAIDRWLADHQRNGNSHD